MPYFQEKVLDGFALSGHEIHLPCAIGARPLVKSMDKVPNGPAKDYGEVLTYTAEVLHEADPRGSISLPQTSEPMPIYTVNIYIYIYNIYIYIY